MNFYLRRIDPLIWLIICKNTTLQIHGIERKMVKISIQSITIIKKQKRYQEKCQSISSIRARQSEGNGAINKSR